MFSSGKGQRICAYLLKAHGARISMDKEEPLARQRVRGMLLAHPQGEKTHLRTRRSRRSQSTSAISKKNARTRVLTI